ncbi:hypothetical protein [Lentzea sp. NPDC092896]|uniref:hypothetical protein n=1 Tax=Lentzea sp. NPDC092896 TaxID=3364127 RepID=UPI00380C030D
MKTTLTNAETVAGFHGPGDRLDDLTPTLDSSCSALPQQPGPAGQPPITERLTTWYRHSRSTHEDRLTPRPLRQRL